MRHLVDLDGKVAVITYWENYIFPSGSFSRYKGLLNKKGWKEISEEEEAELKQISKQEGKVEVRIENIQIALMHSFNTIEIPTSIFIHGDDFILISQEIEKLRKSLEGKTILMEDAKETDLPF